MDSNRGLSPQPHSDTAFKVAVPKMTAEFKEQMVKSVNAMAEEAKETLRRIRKDGMDLLKKAKSSYGKDEIRRYEKELQTLVDKRNEAVAKRLKDKVAELGNAE